MDSSDEQRDDWPERPGLLAPDPDDPAFKAAVLRARLWVLLIGGIALAGIVIMCLTVALLILSKR